MKNVKPTHRRVVGCIWLVIHVSCLSVATNGGATILTIPSATFLPHRSDKLASWYKDWIASFPLILLTVLIHVSGLAVIKNRAIDLVERAAARGRRNFVFALIIGCIVLLVTMLHAIDAAVWGVAYLAEAGARIVIVANTSTGAAFATSKVMPWVVTAALVAWNVGYGRLQKRRGEALAAAGAARASADDEQAGNQLAPESQPAEHPSPERL